MEACRIMLADDHPIFRDCIRKMLVEERAVKLIGEVEDGSALLELLRSTDTQPDLILLDISMPKLDGIETARLLKRIRPNLRILILSIHSDPAYLQQAFSAGADGYLLKEDADTQLLAAIDAVCRGRTFISPSFSCDLKKFSTQQGA